MFFLQTSALIHGTHAWRPSGLGHVIGALVLEPKRMVTEMTNARRVMQNYGWGCSYMYFCTVVIDCINDNGSRDIYKILVGKDSNEDAIMPFVPSEVVPWPR